MDPARPPMVTVERERTFDGKLVKVAAVILAGAECPWRCVFCDLWQHTLDGPTPPGAIAAQVTAARQAHPRVRHFKLYNAGSFFDRRAVPPGDVDGVVAAMRGVRTVVVECHPKLVGPPVLDFAADLGGTLEVAMGLETAHPETLARLNKRMTVNDFRRATTRLADGGVRVRAFILVRPPYLPAEAALEWACRSVDVAQAAGAECCVLIPTRGGNGAMEALREAGDWSPPSLETLEAALAYGVARARGRVFADLWDAERVFAGAPDLAARLARLRKVNETQRAPRAGGAPAGRARG